MAMNTKGGRRREKRRKERKENRRLRKEGADTAYLGGSKEKQKELVDEAGDFVDETRDGVRESRKETAGTLKTTQDSERQATRDFANSKRTAELSRSGFAGGIDSIGKGAADAATIRNNALATNQLTGSAESILAQRQAQLAGVPTIGQATETAIGSNMANANAMLTNQAAIQNRAARGLAGSMGEGGALAMQQAMATAGAGTADQAAASQLAQAQLAAQMRFGAAQTQNAQDVAAANQAVDLRMGAAEAERAAALGFADTNANQSYDATLQAQQARGALMGQDANSRDSLGARQAGLLGQVNSVATNRAALAAESAGQAANNQQFMIGTAAQIDQMENQRRYQEAKNKNPFQKLVSTVFDPGDLRGSGYKGVVG